MIRPVDVLALVDDGGRVSEVIDLIIWNDISMMRMLHQTQSGRVGII